MVFGFRCAQNHHKLPPATNLPTTALFFSLLHLPQTPHVLSATITNTSLLHHHKPSHHPSFTSVFPPFHHLTHGHPHLTTRPPLLSLSSTTNHPSRLSLSSTSQTLQTPSTFTLSPPPPFVLGLTPSPLLHLGLSPPPGFSLLTTLLSPHLSLSTTTKKSLFPGISLSSATKNPPPPHLSLSSTTKNSPPSRLSLSPPSTTAKSSPPCLFLFFTTKTLLPHVSSLSSTTNKPHPPPPRSPTPPTFLSPLYLVHPTHPVHLYLPLLVPTPFPSHTSPNNHPLKTRNLQKCKLS